VETALIVAIVAEAGFVTFMNREKVFDLFRTNSGQQTAEQVTAHPEPSVPLPEAAEMIYTVGIESAQPTVVTQTPTAVSTPPPGIVVVTAAGAAETDSSGVSANSTPVPDTSITNDNGNNGNHYGQTPEAERTKESNGDGEGSDQTDDNNDNRDNGNRRVR
jgi:hypothetical protein